MEHLIRPVIFLDIDGPLRSRRSKVIESKGFLQKKKNFTAGLDPVAVSCLRLLLLKSNKNPEVILTSSWKDNLGYATVSNYLGFHIDGQTRSRGTREEEILDWIQRRKKKEEYFLTSLHQFIVIDDIAMTDKHLRNNQILVDAKEGLTFANMEALARMLGLSVYDL